MIRTALAVFALLTAATAAAQSQQEALDQRYDRALAAGYKALFLCSAIANAERNGGQRREQSIAEFELTGIQPPFASMIADMPHDIVRAEPSGVLDHVRVDWASEAVPRIAFHKQREGCSLLPIGKAQSPQRTFGTPQEIDHLKGWLPFAYFDDYRAQLREPERKAYEAEYGKGTRTTALVIVKDRRVQLDSYRNDFGNNAPQRTWSVAKSIAATLVGAAVHRGEISVSDTSQTLFADDDPRAAITLDQYLRMASGRYSDTPGNRTNPLYYGGSSVAETAFDWPLIHQPGSTYRYANNDTLMATELIRSTFDAHPPSVFFEAIGMRNTVAETDWEGRYILSSQVWTTAKDLARLGQLYLNDGMWGGERILPEGWVQYVSSPSGPQPEGRPFGYGAGFWLMNQSDGVPSDTFAAFGNRGQYVVIVPSRDVVIVRRGEDPTGSRFDIAAFTRDVLAALEE